MAEGVVFLLLCILSFEVNRTLSQDAVSTTPMTMAEQKVCPFLLITPHTLQIYRGKTATFEVAEEAKVHSALEVQWQKSKYNGWSYTPYLTYLNITERKYHGSELFHSPKLVINDAQFEDEGYYRIQVRIREGWCNSRSVHFRVRGTLRYHDACNSSKECDSWKYSLSCSEKYHECLCQSSYYHRNKTCYDRSYLGASVINYNISTSVIGFTWGNSSRDDDLVTSYRVELTEYRTGKLIANASVGTNRSFNVKSNFIPGNSYVYTIISTVRLSDPSETILVRANIHCTVEPLPPGPIDKNSSDFHPEHLYISWARPANDTRVGDYYIIIDGFSRYTYNNATNKHWPRRLRPGKNYTVSLRTRALYWYFNGKVDSEIYQEQIETLKVPIVYITSNESVTVPFLSNFEISASVQNVTGFPKVTKTKWQKLQNGTETDIDITESRYKGSTTDLSQPVLVINGVDFDNDNGSSYQLAAFNSEGWGTSLNVSNITVIGSLKFLEPCNKSRECVPVIGLECHNNVCLCSPLHYHKNGSCYDRQRLRAQDIQLESSTCNISLKWKAPGRDKSLVVGYYVVWEENTFGHWETPVNVSVGIHTEYQSECNLLPGRLYRFRVRVEIHLTNPDQTVFVDSFFTESETILEPLPPGPVSNILSNYSADNLYLRWNASEFDSFVNRYKVSIDGHDQTTDGNEPEIYWNELLEPHKPYNVSIIAISFGYTVNYPLNGSRDSRPSVSQIITEDSRYSGKAFMPYSNDDFILTGDDVTGDILRSPTTVYIGDGSVEGFTFVKIGSNGVIGLGNSKSDFNDVNVNELTSKKLKNRQILCPFWTDMLTSDTDGKVYYNHYKRRIV